MTATHGRSSSFSGDPSGLRDSTRSPIVELADGDAFDLRIAPVAKRLGESQVRMLAYNGSIPGPTLRVRQGTRIAVCVRNDAAIEATVHWHGLRVDNAFDGVPHETQAPIAVGDNFTYQLRFPDPGLYLYHPHIREDYGLEMGLYGNIVVDPVDDDYWPPVDGEHVLTLDDVLVENGRITPFNADGPTHVAMGRFGNVMLSAGETALALSASVGDVARFYFTNTANTRLYNIAMPGARMKLVGGDSGRYERETFVDEVLLSPSERAIVDVLFDSPGTCDIEHRTAGRTYVLGTVAVAATASEGSLVARFDELRTDPDLSAERARIEVDRSRAPDKTLAFESLMPLLYGGPTAATDVWSCPMHPELLSERQGVCPSCGMRLLPATSVAPSLWTCPMHPEFLTGTQGACPSCGMKLMPSTAGTALGGATTHDQAHSHDAPDGLEWEDLMPEINRSSDSSNMTWKFVDRDTGQENEHIDWAFEVGDRVKIRLENGMAQDHPMHHPFHIHGAGRFLVLSRNGSADDNLVWKDTVLVRAGETVDILLDVTNPGRWMAHCHIAEHHQAGMMFSFVVAARA